MARLTGFAALDGDNNGYISAREAGKRRGLLELMRYFDADLDGRLSRNEYRELREDAAHAVETWAQAKRAPGASQ